MQQCIQTLLIWLDSFANVYNLSVCLVSSLNFRLHIHNFCTVFLKITKEVSFIIASEASYNYILTEQKFMKNTKNGHKLVENAKIEKHKWDIFGDFQTL